MAISRVWLKWSPCVLAITIGSCAGVAQAQLPRPHLTSLSRIGVRVGESVETTVRGTDLEGAERLWFDHPGITADRVKDGVFRVTARPDAPLGCHDVRVVGRFGVSNPRTFVIGDRPETAETEPNNSPDRANPVEIGFLINGAIDGATDVDHFAFTARRGQRLFIELDAERVESRLDATIRLSGPAGTEIAESRDVMGADPFLDIVIPADGRYVLKVHDAIYGGAPDYAYRLTIHEGPYLDAISPCAASVGGTRRFRWIGRGLGAGATVEPALSAGGPALEVLESAVSLAPDDLVGPADARPPGLLTSSASAFGRRGFEIALAQAGASGRPAWRSRSLFVADTDLPIDLEHEPNDPDHPQIITPPCDVSGAFHPSGDVDLYQFQGKKGDIWWIEAVADRMGSSADPSIVVRKPGAKGAPPTDLARADDSPDQGLGARFNTQTVDPRLRWSVPEDGPYQIEISDLYGSQRGHPRLAYRLVVRKEQPDFDLVLTPYDALPDGSATVRAGGRALAVVAVVRHDGFAGAIRVEAHSLPQGVHMDPVTIAANQSLAPVVLEADEKAATSVGLVQLVGRSRFGDRKDELSYVPQASMLGPDLSRLAIAGAMTGPPNPSAQSFAQARLIHGFVLAVLAEPAPLALAASPRRLIAAQGSRLALDLSITRRNGMTEPIAVTAADLPPNVPNAATTIPKTDSTGSLTLYVPRVVPTGLYSFTLRAAAPYPFSKDPAAKTKPNINLAEPSNPIELVVRPAPLNLSIKKSAGTIKPGGTLEIEAALTRQNGAQGIMTLTLTAAKPLGLSADPVVVPAGESAAKLTLKAAKDAPVGPAASVFLSASIELRGETIRVDEPLPLAIAK